MCSQRCCWGLGSSEMLHCTVCCFSTFRRTVAPPSSNIAVSKKTTCTLKRLALHSFETSANKHITAHHNIAGDLNTQVSHFLPLITPSKGQVIALVCVSVPCGVSEFRRFAETYWFHLQADWLWFMRVLKWLGRKKCVGNFGKVGGNMSVRATGGEEAEG